jgi:flagellar basal body-associated protein FliL
MIEAIVLAFVVMVAALVLLALAAVGTVIWAIRDTKQEVRNMQESEP